VVVVAVLVVVSVAGVVSKTVVGMSTDVSAADSAVVDHVSATEEVEVEATIMEVPDDGLQRPAYTLDVARTTVKKCFKV
jgi:hypothetical protein